MSKYIFSEPIQEGIKDNKPFFVIEVSEIQSKVGVTKRTKISQEYFNTIINSIFR
jgi:hypothetical protein